MRAAAVLALIAVLGFVSACAPKSTPLPTAAAPRYPEFVEPVATAEFPTSPAARVSTRAWQFLQAGDLRSAEREVAAALALAPNDVPSRTVSAYLALARKDAGGAATLFSGLVEAHPQYVPALAGKGLALEAAGEAMQAVGAYRQALALDPALVDLARRADVLTLRGLQDELTTARDAARQGETEAAIRAYRNAIAASPDSPFLYRELAAIERVASPDSAVEHLRRAHELDPADASTLVLLGDLLDAQGDLPGAMTAFADALALDPDPAVEAKQAALRARLALAALPEQYRAIDAAAQVTRADLAALIGVRLPDLVQAAPVRDIGVLTDIRGNWAERWIAPVARAGVMEALPNHTFQPRAVVRRVDLAQAAARLLGLAAERQPERGREWTDARLRFSDITGSHLAYPAVSTAVAAGVLAPTEAGAFQPTRAISGAEAIDAVERIRRLATASPGDASNRP